MARTEREGRAYVLPATSGHQPRIVVPKQKNPRSGDTEVQRREARSGRLGLPPGSLPTGADGPEGYPLKRWIGPFRLDGELGRGGMGVVYRAFDARLERTVALKLLQCSAPLDVARFQVEARAAARLKHPDIVSVHEVGRCNDTWYMALDLIEGESLQARLARQGPMPEVEAARVVERIARALQYAHEEGILHRDVKPGNILVTREGDPRLVDFGLAKDQRDARHLTTVGDILGTPAFMAPEQKRGHPDEVGVAADVFGLGGTLLCLLSGLTPGEPYVLREVVADRRLREICACALDPTPDSRYASAAALADDLARYLNNDRDLRETVRDTVVQMVRVKGSSVRAAAAVVIGCALLGIGAMASLVSDTDLVAERAGPGSDSARPSAEPIAGQLDPLDPFDPERPRRPQRQRRGGDRPAVAGPGEDGASVPRDRPVRDGSAPPAADAPREQKTNTTPARRRAAALAATTPRGSRDLVSTPDPRAADRSSDQLPLIAWFQPPSPELTDEEPEATEQTPEPSSPAPEILATVAEDGAEPILLTEALPDASASTSAEPGLEAIDLKEGRAPTKPREVFDDFRDYLDPARAAKGYAWSSYYQANTNADGYVTALAVTGPGELLVGHAPGQIDRIAGGKATPQATFSGPVQSVASGDAGVVASSGAKVYERLSGGTWAVSLDPKTSAVHVASLDDDLYAFASSGTDATVYRRKQADDPWEITATLAGIVPTVTAALDDDELWVAGQATRAGEPVRVYKGEKDVWTELTAVGGKVRPDERQAVTALLAVGPHMFVAVTTWDPTGAPIEGEVLAADGSKLKRIGKLPHDAILSLGYSDRTLYLGTQRGNLLYVERDATPLGGKKKPKLKLRFASELGLPLNGGVHAILPAGGGALLLGVRGPYGAEVLLRSRKP